MLAFRGRNFINTPINSKNTNEDNDFYYFARCIIDSFSEETDPNYASITAIDVRSNEIFCNTLVGGFWIGWDKVVTNSVLPIMEGKVLNPNSDIATITLSYPVKTGGYLHAVNGNYEVSDFVVIGARVDATERQNITVKLSKTVN